MEAGRRAHQRTLFVYLRGEQIGLLENRGGGRLRFRYTEEAVARYDGTYLLSYSLPVREGSYSNSQCRPYFDGLLPEGALRDTIARSLGSSPDNTFSLLEELGGDCAGAVVLRAEDAQPDDVGHPVRWLSDDELREKLENLEQAPLGVDPEGGIRLSLAGAQPKLVAIRDPAGRIGLPRGAMPSNVILKPAQAAYDELVTNEAFCLKVAQSAGAETATARVEQLVGVETLVVDRFDRTFDNDGRLIRLHQEDFCQALSRLPREKYEHEGGPAFRDLIATVRTLRTPGLAGAETELWRALLLNFLLGNADAHAKNYSLLSYERELDGQVFYDIRLAPLYDIVSTAVYPNLTRDIAMSIGGTFDPDEVDFDRFREEARLSDLGGAEPARLVRVVGEQIVNCARATRDLARAEGWHRGLIDRIVEVCEARAAQLGVGG